MAMLAVVVVANVRRGRSGRRLIAVRTNERAAAALGINVMVAKLFAFALASAIAALGGIVLAFRLSSISYESFSNFTSITYVGLALLGGVGQLLGAIVGSTLATAGVTQEILETTWEGVGRWIQLISGVGILLTLVIYKDGIAAEWVRMSRAIKKMRKWSRPYTIELADVADGPSRRRPRGAGPGPHADRRGPDRALRRGGRRRRRQLPTRARHRHRSDRTERRRQDVARSTPSADSPRRRGRVLLDDLDLSKQPAMKRARAGLARSFQSLELFEDSTVFENLSVAADPQDLRSYLLDLIWPINPLLPPEVVRAITEFDLEDDLHRDVQDLSYGKRRLLAIARAVAMQPSVLLLDEPAAGLSSTESRRAGPPRAPPGRRLGHGDPRRRARHELRDGRLRRGHRARLRQADRGGLARGGAPRSGRDRRLPR